MQVNPEFVARDIEAEAVSIRVDSKGNLGAEPHIEVIADLLRAVATGNTWA